ASKAVSTLLAELEKASTPDGATQKIAWTIFVRDISALHTAADAAQAEACVALFARVEGEFRKLEEAADPGLLKAAHQYAERYTCPMHADVVGAENDTCGKCGMALDQLVVLVPSDAATQHAVTATITTGAPLEEGKPAHAVLHLRRADNEPVTLAELFETHTRKIHLLVVDGSLTDYHHEHPQPTGTPGDYAFDFTPTKPGPYLAWADLRAMPMGLQEYEKAIIAGLGLSEPIANKEPRLTGDAGGLHFELNLGRARIKAGEPTSAKLRMTRPDGSGFDRLEPVMAAFAHLVGFNEDKETVLHMHPIGAPISNEKERGGPELEFKIYAAKPGFVRLFAQVQVEGRQVFVPFNIEILP
ncbi:MAG: heavy metal-binding domain-containing protein, partial [Spartobacteria bacterium]